MATEYELTLSDYVSIVRRRASYIITIFVVVFLASIVTSVIYPPTYRSTGTIMIESQQVPENMVPSAIRNQLNERINIINQRVMTRENLLQISNKYGLFSENSGSITTTELIDKLRDRIIIEPVRPSDSLPTGQQGQPMIAFTISFEDRHPETALQVTKDIVSLFLDLNVKLRTEGAAETTEFLTQESEKLKAEVDRLEGMIGAFKKRNSENLPEQLNLRATMLARAENDLYEVERDIRSSNEALRALEAELTAAKRGMVAENPAQSLSSLKAEYTRLSAIYTESHPDIRALKRKIDALENASVSQASDSSPADASSLNVYMIQAKVDAANARLDSLAKQKKMLQDKIAQNEHAMMQTPKVAQELDVLIRDRDSAQKKYEEILNKKMNAKIAENLESENKSERLILIEPPLMPEKPFKPDRKKILIMGFLLALVSSGGAVMALESVDKRIRGTDALAHVLGYRPLVVIPYITIIEEGLRRKRIIKLAVSIGVVVLIAMVLAIHFFYRPLDTIFIRIMSGN